MKPPVTCLHQLLEQTLRRANDAYWNDDDALGDRLKDLAASYIKRIDAGETVDVNF